MQYVAVRGTRDTEEIVICIRQPVYWGELSGKRKRVGGTYAFQVKKMVFILDNLIGKPLVGDTYMWIERNWVL
jgi:hypothetical protein